MDNSLSFVNNNKKVLLAMYTNELRAIFSEPGLAEIIRVQFSWTLEVKLEY